MRATTYEALNGWNPTAAHEAAAAVKAAAAPVKTAAMLVAAPFIGLAFAVGFPVFGLAALAWMATRAAREEAAA